MVYCSFGTSSSLGCGADDHGYIKTWVESTVRIHNNYVRANGRSRPGYPDYHAEITNPDHIQPGFSLYLPTMIGKQPRCNCSRQGNSCSCTAMTISPPIDDCNGGQPGINSPSTSQPTCPAGLVQQGDLCRPVYAGCKNFLDRVASLPDPHRTGNWGTAIWLDWYTCVIANELDFDMNCQEYPIFDTEEEIILTLANFVSFFSVAYSAGIPLLGIVGTIADMGVVGYAGAEQRYLDLLIALGGFLPYGDAVTAVALGYTLLINNRCNIDWTPRNAIPISSN